MAWTEEAVFESDVLVEPKKLVGEYEFYLQDTSIKIRIHIYKDLRAPVPSEPFYFDISHAIHTPAQIGPYNPTAPWASDLNFALRRAVKSIAFYYKEAVSKGHEPGEEWLIRMETSRPNKTLQPTAQLLRSRSAAELQSYVQGRMVCRHKSQH